MTLQSECNGMGVMKDLHITIYNGGDEAVAAVHRMGDDWRAQLEQAAAEIEALREAGSPPSNTHGCGWVIETKSWNGESMFWRNGHGWMATLRQATIFVKKNDAIGKCVKLGSKKCTVMEASFSLGKAVYPPSQVEQQ